MPDPAGLSREEIVQMSPGNQKPGAKNSCLFLFFTVDKPHWLQKKGYFQLFVFFLQLLQYFLKIVKDTTDPRVELSFQTVHITNSYNNLDQISALESRPSINIKIWTKFLVQNCD